MIQTQDILYNITGQSLIFDAPEGRPSSVTSVSVFESSEGDDDTGESATTGSASVESDPNTTVDAASGAGQADPRLLNVTATTGFEVGRSYVVEAADGAKEWFEVMEVDSGNSVTARYPLANSYAAADTVYSTRVSISIADAWVQDDNNISDDPDPNPGYRVRWVYVVDSVTRVHDTYFNLVRYQGKHSVTPSDMGRFFPNWLAVLPHHHREDQGRSLIDEAYELVKWDFHKSGKASEMVRNSEGVAHLVKYRAAERLMVARIYAGEQVDVTLISDAREQYQQQLDSLIRVTTKLPFSVDTEGDAHPVEPLRITRR